MHSLETKHGSRYSEQLISQFKDFRTLYDPIFTLGSRPMLLTSLTVRAASADVTFRSADGTLFSVHRKNLETHAGGFPPSEFQTLDEVVQLTEDASTLELLFQYIYPQRLPDLETVPFEELASLAEAAEKYEVFSAMYICHTCLRSLLPDHLMDIVAYASKHGYPEIIADVAPLLLDKPMTEMMAILPLNLFRAWIIYYEHWNRVRQYVIQTDGGQCGHSSTLVRILRKLADLKSYRNLDEVFSMDYVCCESMKRFTRSMRENVEKSLKRIPKYTELVGERLERNENKASDDTNTQVS